MKSVLRNEAAPQPAPKKIQKVQAASAVEMGAKQREISVSEFFTKNRHLLGFDNPRKALLTCVKEAVDNSLDACEEAGIRPGFQVRVEVVPTNGTLLPPSQATRFKMTITDNGPGIVKEQIPRIFAKLLYGSKFHRLRMSRGQQGIGISAAGMYGQLTTGKPVKIISRTSDKKPANYFEIQIDTKKNEPIIHKRTEMDDWHHARGTEVSIELEGRYQKGRASVDEYLELTCISNPHATLIYYSPEGQKFEYPRTFNELPPPTREIKPHPYGIELGILLKMMHDTKSHWLSGFLTSDFSRVSARTAAEICQKAGLDPRSHPRKIARDQAEKLYQAIQNTKIMAPPTDCISPIGEKAILAGLYKQVRGDFYTAATRPPAVYRGNPFVIEVGLAFGTGDGATSPERQAQALAEGETHDEETEQARVIRYANRVPLMYQQSACSAYKSVLETAWKNYGVQQSRGALPQGPIVVFVHMASVWVPFTSESKEAIADYDEIRKEMKLALQECGRRLGAYLRRRANAKSEFNRRNIFALYIDEVAEACSRLKLKKLDTERLKKQLLKIAIHKTGGEKTDELLGRNKKELPEELPHSIIVTPEGIEGEVPEPEQLELNHEDTKNTKIRKSSKRNKK